MEYITIQHLQEKIIQIKQTHPTLYTIWNNYLICKEQQHEKMVQQINMLTDNITNNNVEDIPIQTLILLLTVQNI